MGYFLEYLHIASDWVQNAFGGFEIIVSLTGAVFSIFAWIKAKSIERKLSIKKPSEFSKGENHVVLAVDLTAEVLTESKAKGMVQKFATQLDQFPELYKQVYDIEPLDEFEEISISMDNFNIGYVPFTDKENAQIQKGRFVTFCGKKMPTNSDDAHTYMGSLNVAINNLFAKLSERGVTSVHIIFQGPYVASMLFGTKLANHFKVYYYQHSDGQYYYVASGGKVGIR